MDIGPRTRFAVLLGDPVEHSYSPIIHNAAYRIQGVDAVYLAVRVSAVGLRDAVAGLAAMGALGANLTLPHKQSVLSLVDEVRADARAVGAVNTIVLADNGGRRRLVGENTDVTGFLSPLAELRDDIRGRPAVLLGAGGAARAVLYACQTSLRMSHITVVARNRGRADRMVRELAEHSGGDIATVIDFDAATGPMSEASLIVNTTPVGMYPDAHLSPWTEPSVFRAGQIVYDLVYNPVTTRFLSDAAKRGALTLNGLEMLIAQAAAAHTLWTGLRMPVADVRDVVVSAIEARS